MSITRSSTTVTAIIPTWNRADLLPQILESVLGQTQPPDQVIVIDNGSTDKTRDVGYSYGVEVATLPENFGFARAINEGIAKATSKWIMMVNNDVRLRADWLKQLLQSCEDTGAAFGSGKLLKADEEGTVDGSWDLVSRAAFAWRCGYGRPDGSIWSARKTISSAPMTAALFRREVFDLVGLLETRFGSYYEDVDFGIRCAAAGLSGIYEPKAVAVHVGKATLGSNGGRVEFMTARNQILLLAKHYSAGTLRHFAWPILIGQVLALAAAAKHGFLRDTLLGKWEGLCKWRAFRHTAAGSGEYQPSSEEIEAAFLKSELELCKLQSEIGPDLYWRTYFRLVPRPEAVFDPFAPPKPKHALKQVEAVKVD